VRVPILRLRQLSQHRSRISYSAYFHRDHFLCSIAGVTARNLAENLPNCNLHSSPNRLISDHSRTRALLLIRQIASMGLRSNTTFQRAIVLVSRRFYQISAEVLHTTFHANAGGMKGTDWRLVLFSELLVSRPELGKSVKRLTLRWSVGDEEKDYWIISRCPSVMISSSFLRRYDTDHVPWWRRESSQCYPLP
jgi:hypothetical protein